jgi:hypothetical protein
MRQQTLLTIAYAIPFAAKAEARADFTLSNRFAAPARTFSVEQNNICAWIEQDRHLALRKRR